MSNKKILFVWTDLQNGGASKALLILANELKKKYSVKILLCYDNNAFRDICNGIDIISVSSPTNERFIKLLKYFKMTLFIFWNTFKSNVIIAHDTPLVVILVGIINKLLFRKKVIYWIHVCKSELQQNKSSLINSLLKNILNRASGCVCVSETAKKSLIDYARYNKNIYNIYNLSEKNLSIKTSWNSMPKKITLSALGRLSKEKGFDVLIEALNKIINEMNFKKIILKIAGDGPEYENLKLLINKYNINEYVVLIGFVSEPLRFINESDIFISPSRSESFGYNVIEALQCKKPVIVTDTGAAEIVEYGKYGIVVTRNDPKVLADAIYELAMNPLKREKLSKITHMALNDSKKIIEQWIDIIEN